MQQVAGGIDSKLAGSISRCFGAQQWGLEREHFPCIFKQGDDLRQDQLVMQLINLMDKLLKRVNLDMSLTPFKVLATSTDDGIMQCITGAFNIADARKI